MNTLIIYCHPYAGSFNHAILDTVVAAHRAAGRAYDVIDLHADGFDPRYSAAELALFSRGETLDPLVLKYQEKLRRADRVIIIAPVWWNDVPGMLKGFFDVVMKMKFAYTIGAFGIRGMLTHIKSATVITTSASPKWYLRWFCGNAISGVFLNGTLKQLGMGPHRRWIGLGMIKNISGDARVRFLNRLPGKLKI